MPIPFNSWQDSRSVRLAGRCLVGVIPGRGQSGDGLRVVFDSDRQRRRIEDHLQDREPY
jgi:hypothetical protein